MAAIGLGASQVLTIPEDYKWIFATIGAIGLVVLGGGAKQFNVHSTVKEVTEATEQKVKEVVGDDAAMVAAREKAKLAAEAKKTK